ncbi:MAG: NAD kinase [Lautropia sp.]
MTARFKSVALFGRPQTDGLAAILETLTRWLQARGVEVLVQANRSTRALQRIGRKAELGIIVGGDGTMLGLARTLAPLGLPLVGINLGRLGFITDIAFSHWEESLTAILDGDFEIEDRALIDATVIRRGRRFFHARALNDVVVSRSSRAGMIEVEVRVDGLFMYGPRADGLIVATPTGSTAYALSASGPILHPALQGFVLVPVAPQALSNRPIVLPDHCEIELTVVGGRNPRVNCDMQSFADLQIEDQVILRRSADSSRFLHPPGYNYYGTLRSKLNWHEMPSLNPPA